MSPDRSQAYQRVMHTLDELGPSKLQREEQDRVRDTRRTTSSSPASSTGEAALALTDALDLCEALVVSGRWERVTAERLADDITACGPAPEPAVVGQAA